MEGLKIVSPKLPEFVGQIIKRFAKETYGEIAYRYSDHFGNNPNEIFYQNVCQQFSEIMRKKLEKQDIYSEYQIVNVKSLIPRSKHHIILSTRDYLIDGTWQQFLDEPRNDHRCLILNKKSLESDLEKAFVPKKLWFIYGVRLVAQS
jgi:hypothetical protein